MTFLKKLAGLILKGAALVTGIAPLAEIVRPGDAGKIQTISNDLAQIAQLVVIAESIGQANAIPGPQRAAFIAAQVEQIVLQSSVLAGKKIAQPALLRSGCQEIAGGIADVLNSIHEDSAKSENLT